MRDVVSPGVKLRRLIGDVVLQDDDQARMGLGTFQALETLALGIHGKLALWRALKVVAGRDDRLGGVDFQKLIAQAQAQHEQVEQNHLLLARSAALVRWASIADHW